MQGIPLSVPYLANLFVPDAGHQPYKPGQSCSASKAEQTSLTLKPWPTFVQTINALVNSPGLARNRAPTALVNNFSPLPANYLFIAGFSSKSQG